MKTSDMTMPVASTPIEIRSEHRSGLAPTAEKGRLRDLIFHMGLGEAQVRGVDAQIPLTLWRAHQDTSLLLEGAAATSLYVVRSGSFKCVKTLEDGYDQVLSLALVGELLGAEALHGGRQPATVVALEDTTVYALPVRDLPELRRLCPVLDSALELALSRQLVRAADTASMTAAVASEVRLARFLLWLSARMADIGQSPHRLLLRMGRRDIASLLCVAHETVSRAFTALSDEGHIKVDRRELEILDPDRLRAFARCTRGLLQEPARGRQRTRPAVAAVSSPWLASVAAAGLVAA